MPFGTPEPARGRAGDRPQYSGIRARFPGSLSGSVPARILDPSFGPEFGPAVRVGFPGRRPGGEEPLESPRWDARAVWHREPSRAVIPLTADRPLVLDRPGLSHGPSPSSHSPARPLARPDPVVARKHHPPRGPIARTPISPLGSPSGAPSHTPGHLQNARISIWGPHVWVPQSSVEGVACGASLAYPPPPLRRTPGPRWDPWDSFRWDPLRFRMGPVQESAIHIQVVHVASSKAKRNPESASPCRHADADPAGPGSRTPRSAPPSPPRSTTSLR